MIFQGGMVWLIYFYFLCKYCRLLLCSYHVVVSHSVVADSLWPHVLQHTRFPCPSLSPGVCLTSIELMMPHLHLILCRPLLLLPSIFPSTRVFSNGWTLHIRWPKYWSFNLSISPPNAYSELTPCSIDLFDLLAVQRTLKSLLYHHSLKESIL